MLLDAFLELFAVCIDQLAGEDDDALLAGFETFIKENGQLSRERVWRGLFHCGLRIIYDAGFCCVAGDVLQIVALCDLNDLCPIFSFVRIVACIDDGDYALAVDLLAVLGTAKIQCVETFLLIDELCETLSDGLYEGNFAVPADFLIGHVEPVIYKCTQEISFAKLQDLDRSVFEDVSVVAGILQYFII